MNTFLIFALCWLVGACVFYLLCKNRLPEGSWFQNLVNCLLWPFILIAIVVLRFYNPGGSRGGD
jgi:cell shape-determining protein MreD